MCAAATAICDEHARLPPEPSDCTPASQDHDFGINDGDRRYELRNASQALFLDFLDVPAASPRRHRAGVYGSHDLAHPAGLGTVKVLLLDNRYARDPYRTPGGDFLGAEQWAWLEAELAASSADVHLLVSGLQVLPEHRPVGESWSRFPEARARLLDMLLRLRVRAPVLLSGDVHYGELHEATCAQDGRGGGGGGEAPHARLIEITSSGLTHAWGHRLTTRDIDWPEAHFGPFEGALQAHLGWMAMHWVQRSLPFRYQRRGGDGTPQYLVGLNFGEVAIDWESRSLFVALRDHRGTARHTASFALDELGAPATAAAAAAATPAWRCVGYRGDVSPAYATARLALSLCLALLALLGGPMCMLRASCGLACGWLRRAARRGDPAKKAQ